MYNEKLGIIGGFGAYATLNFYKRFLEIFATDSERNYPHIIMDNNFTMPSRTRALLYDEGYEEITEEIANSMKWMIAQRVDRIVLVCGTAHYFLEDVYKLVPQASEKVVDIIQILGEELEKRNQKDVLIIAAEGALQKNLYSEKLKKNGISCVSPQNEMYEEIRYFIEGVKRNELSRDMAYRFIMFLRYFKVKSVILGCTEFPVLVTYITNMEMEENQRNEWDTYQFWDPLEMTIQNLKQTFVPIS